MLTDKHDQKKTHMHSVLGLTTKNMDIYTLPKEKYPYLLQQINQIGDEMDVIGTAPSDSYTFLCIVGSRAHTSYGERMCRQLVTGLTGYPIVIVSGLAVGLDSIAHEAALNAGLKTISFPGSGLDPNVLYPRSRQSLAEKIVQSGGALMSRFPRFQKADDWTFPARNRLMAGISHATLVIEARRGSGTLITAKYAEEFNRDVLAVPGPIDSELSYGPHMLIRRGATPITSSQDILEALGFTETTRYDNDDERALKLYQTLPKEKKRRMRRSASGDDGHDTPGLFTVSPLVPKPQKPITIDLNQLALSPAERSICTHILNESLSATDLIEKTSLPVSTLSITMTELELKGLIRNEGGRYRLMA
jgi:DNA protecting protein DprA